MQLVDERYEYARAAGADRVPKGHAAAADIQLLMRDRKRRDIREHLCRKCLVHLKEVDVRNGLAGLLQQLLNSNLWCREQVLRRDTGRAVSNNPRQHFQAKFLRLRFAHHQHRCGAVRNLTRIASRHRAVLRERGAQLRKTVRGGVRAETFINIQAGLRHALLGRQRNDLRLEPTVLGCLGRAAIALSAECILRTAGHAAA